MKSYPHAENARRIVIKIGSSTLTHATGKLNLRRLETLAKVIADFSNAGREVVLVSSGSISAGMAKLGLAPPLEKIGDKMAAAAVGQAELMNIYDRFFMQFGIKIAQILLTRDVIENDARRQNAEETFRVLINMGCLPIVNENDTVSSDEINFSANVILSASVAKPSKADLLVNLSDIDGLYSKNPAEHADAELIREVAGITPEILSYAGGAGSPRGTGGMATKLQAALLLREERTPMIIANGTNPEILYDILGGKIAGTYIINNY